MDPFFLIVRSRKKPCKCIKFTSLIIIHYVRPRKSQPYECNTYFFIEFGFFFSVCVSSDRQTRITHIYEWRRNGRLPNNERLKNVNRRVHAASSIKYNLSCLTGIIILCTDRISRVVCLSRSFVFDKPSVTYRHNTILMGVHGRSPYVEFNIVGK